MAMVDAISRDLDKKLGEAPGKRAGAIKVTPSNIAARKSRLAEILGVVDSRVALPGWEVVQPGGQNPFPLGEDIHFRLVRWPVLEGVHGEAILLQSLKQVPNPQPIPVQEGGTVVGISPALVYKKPARDLIILADPEEWPEHLAGLLEGSPKKAARLIEACQHGDRVWILPLIDRRDDRSINERAGRATNQPHREFVYRMAFEMGRHILGYEVQRVLGLLDALEREGLGCPVRVWGWGEGGHVALFAAALDERIQAVGVSGAFSPRESVWSEPIYRNIWSYVSEFGDCGVAALLADRQLVVSNEPGPVVAGPPSPRNATVGYRSGAAPGKLEPYPIEKVRSEFRLAIQNRHTPPNARTWHLEENDEAAWPKWLERMPVSKPLPMPLAGPSAALARNQANQRHERLFNELVDHVQVLWKRSDGARLKFLSGPGLARVANWKDQTREKRVLFSEKVIGSVGQLPKAPGEAIPAFSRVIYETPHFQGFEVDIPLDGCPGVFAQGIYLIPKGLKPGEKRPVVVCQHGLEGRPQDVCHPLAKTPYYNSFGAELARLGYIVFAPQNPYIGQDRFRVLQRKANPIGLSLFSYITAQHRAILDWLKTRSEVDPQRLAFYGLSYGGKTAMRVPAILEDYCLSICSGDFNEWVGKNVAYEPWGAYTSYMYTGEYEIYEWNLGHTFNYAEMAYLIAPRPFMVERGHDDGVGIDPMVAWEYAKVREFYTRLGLADRTEIEFFLGGHEIRAKGTFEFLRKHLKYP